MPWIRRVHAGWGMVAQCSLCKSMDLRAHGELVVELEPRRARVWPDLLGCCVGQFVVSERFVERMREDGVRVEIGGGVEIVEPLRYPLTMAGEPPAYFWVDGARHVTARMDFEATGYVDARRCGDCGALLFDVAETYKIQHGKSPSPVVLERAAESGLDLFTTDFSPLDFYCTERVVQCVRRHALTNVALVPVERGVHGEPEE